jgi:fluoride ion exporter CrcB/FEX
MTTTGHGESAPPEIVADELPSGPAAAALLAAGIGSLVLGILTTWAEASESFKEDLQWNDRVGPLSGKTIIASIAFFASWLVLHLIWRRSNPPLQRIVLISAILIVLGLIGTFPTFFQQFAPE